MLERESKEYRSLVVQAQSGDGQAYNQLVHRFQDMAVAYAYSVLGDRGWAEDAAQEAFVEAFVCLANLRDPSAFPGWLRRIVFKHCDRLARKKQLDTVSLTRVAGENILEEPESEPHARWESKERDAQVREAVAQLPEHERITIVLFYMGQHSQQHIAQFLEVPLTTVKKRLHSARKRLRQEMIHTMQHDLDALRPSRNSLFTQRVKDSAQRIAEKYQPDQPSSSGTIGEALATRIRLQVERAQATIEVADKDAQIWYGKPVDCLSVCGNLAHLARHNHLLLIDMAATRGCLIELPSHINIPRPQTMEDVWEFLLMRETDSIEQALSRLKSVNEHIVAFVSVTSNPELDYSIQTQLYQEQSLRDLLLIIIEQGSFCFGQAWGILKLQHYGMSIKD